MSKPIRVLVGIFAAIGLAYVAMLALFFVSPYSESECVGGTPLMEVPSPTNAYKATLQVNNCNPKHQLQTVVFLVGSSFETSAFIASTSALQSAGTFTPLPLRITWLGETQLEIAYPRGTELQSRPDVVHGVNVTYKEFTQNAP